MMPQRLILVQSVQMITHCLGHLLRDAEPESCPRWQFYGNAMSSQTCVLVVVGSFARVCVARVMKNMFLVTFVMRSEYMIMRLFTEAVDFTRFYVKRWLC